MRTLKRLIFRIFDLLALMENKKNQPLVQEIRGLLYEILDIAEKEIED